MDSIHLQRQVSLIFCNTLCQQLSSTYQLDVHCIFLSKVCNALHPSDTQVFNFRNQQSTILMHMIHNKEMSQYVFIDQSCDAGNCFQHEETLQRGCCGFAANV